MGKPAPARILVGANGIRAGWRLLLFAAIIVGLLYGKLYLYRVLHVHAPSPDDKLIFPGYDAANAAINFILVVTATLIMSKIERRPFDVYGLPWRNVLRSRIWAGMLAGFAIIGFTLLCVFALQGFEITGIGTSGRALAASAVLYALNMLFVGLFEEFLLRGYAQYTLTTGIGFWPAAGLLSLGFGALHGHNPGETLTGVVSPALGGLVMCVALRQTGNLWLSVGMHAGLDWGESFFFGVPNSGHTPWHPFLSSNFQGPAWLTGGTAFPDGSIFMLLAFIAAAALIFWRYPVPRYTVEAFQGRLRTTRPDSQGAR
jgi:membrane protease YdiL (CAAX protease family)